MAQPTTTRKSSRRRAPSYHEDYVNEIEVKTEKGPIDCGEEEDFFFPLRFVVEDESFEDDEEIVVVVVDEVVEVEEGEELGISDEVE